MSTDPMAFLRETFVNLFNTGVAELDAKAAAGEAWAKTRLDDIRAANGCAHFVLDGAGEIYLEVSGGQMKAHAQMPASPPTRVAFGTAANAAESGLSVVLGTGKLEDKGTAVRITRLASGKLEKMLEKEKITFHLIVKDVPEIDEVTVRVGLGVSDPPEKPGFTLTVSYDDIEDMRAGDLTPQQLLMKKTKIVGDASRAMTIGMTLMAGR